MIMIGKIEVEEEQTGKAELSVITGKRKVTLVNKNCSQYQQSVLNKL